MNKIIVDESQSNLRLDKFLQGLKKLLYQRYGENLDEYHKLSEEINIVYRNKEVIKNWSVEIFKDCLIKIISAIYR